MYTPEQIVALVGPINSDDDWKAAVAKFEADVALARSAMDELDRGVTLVVQPENLRTVEWVAPTGSMTVRWLTEQLMESLLDGWKETTQARMDVLEQIRPQGTREVWSEMAYSNFCDTDALLRTLYWDRQEFYANMETRRRAVYRRHTIPYCPAFFDKGLGSYLGRTSFPMYPGPHSDIEKALKNVREESSKLHRTARSTGDTDYIRDEALRSMNAFEYWEEIERRDLRAAHIFRVDKVKMRTVKLLWKYFGYPILRRRLFQLRAQESQTQQQQQQQQQQPQQPLPGPPLPLSQPQQQQQPQHALPEQLPSPSQQQQQQQQQMLPPDVDNPMEVDSVPLQVETGEALEDGELAEPLETLETEAECSDDAIRSTPLTSLEPTMLEAELRESERLEEEDGRVRGGRQVVDSDEEAPVVQAGPSRIPDNGGGSGVDNDNDDEQLGDGRVRHRVPCDQCQKRGHDCVGLPQRTCAPCLKQAKGCSLATKGRAVAAKRKTAREARDRETKRRKVTALAASSVGGHVEHEVLQQEVGESELQFVLARMDHRDKVLSRMLNEISDLVAQARADRRLLLELTGVKTGEGENEEEEEGGEEETVLQSKGKGNARR
ncbi:hypothetical protein ACEPAG_3648 [Sanghuangporus baumii]